MTGTVYVLSALIVGALGACLAGRNSFFGMLKAGDFSLPFTFWVCFLCGGVLLKAVSFSVGYALPGLAESMGVVVMFAFAWVVGTIAYFYYRVKPSKEAKK